jgi:hypothetical protein
MRDERWMKVEFAGLSAIVLTALWQLIHFAWRSLSSLF